MPGIETASSLSRLQLLETTDVGRALRSPSSNPNAVNVAQDFESVFASMLLKEMRQSLEPGSLFGSDSGDVYGGMFDQFMGEELAKGRGLGMASMISEGIERQQNAAEHSNRSTSSTASVNKAG